MKLFYDDVCVNIVLFLGLLLEDFIVVCTPCEHTQYACSTSLKTLPSGNVTV